MLSEEAKNTARFLAEAFGNKQVERRFSFYVIFERDQAALTKPGEGVLDPAFRVPVSNLSNLLELEEQGFITLFEERKSSGSKQCEVYLKDRLIDFVKSDFGESERTVDAASQPQIFISYSKQDRRLKRDVEAILSKSYANIWSDAEFIGGEEIWLEILEQVAKSDIFIYLLSSDSINSFACRVEFSEAQRLQKPIIPVLIRPAQVPSYAKSNHWIDVVDDRTAQISERLRSAIGKIASASATQDSLGPSWPRLEIRTVDAAHVAISVSVPAHLEPKKEIREQLNTGILVLPGDQIEISATGKITNDIKDGEPRTWITADGKDQRGRCMTDEHAYWSEYCVGSLVGWIGGTNEIDFGKAFEIGKAFTKTLGPDDPEGFLYLAVNDTIDQYGDNDKAFSVSIDVHRS